MMRTLPRSVAAAALLALLTATASLASPVLRLDPPAPILGKPLSIIITLDDEETFLAGLPDLGPFEPLAPPLQSGREIRLVVLPMRPGNLEIPPFPLQVGTARQIETAPFPVAVLEGIALDAGIAPLKRRPFPIVGSGPGLWIGLAALLLLIIGTGVTLFLRWWRRPDFFKLPRATQLAQLKTRASQLRPTPGRTDLLREIEVHRFAPLPCTEAEIIDLHKRLLLLVAEESR